MKSHKNQLIILLLTLSIILPHLVSAQQNIVPGITNATDCNNMNSNPGTYQSTTPCGGSDYSFSGSLGYNTPTTGPDGQALFFQTNGTQDLSSCYTGFANADCTWACDAPQASALRSYTYSWNGSACIALPGSNNVVSDTCSTSAYSTCTAQSSAIRTPQVCDPVVCNRRDNVCNNWECSPPGKYAYGDTVCEDTGAIDQNACANNAPPQEICAGVMYNGGDGFMYAGYNNGVDDDGNGLIDGADPACHTTFTLQITPATQNVALGNSVSYLITAIPDPTALAMGVNVTDIAMGVTCDPSYTCRIGGGSYGGVVSHFDRITSSYLPLTLTVTANIGTTTTTCVAGPNGIGSVCNSVTTPSAPLGPYTFTVGGSALQYDQNPFGSTATAEVNVLPPSATSVSLIANPATIPYNGTSLLTWSISGLAPITCTGTNMPAGSWATGGSNSIGVSTGALTTNTTYSLNCSGPTGSASDSKTVTVASSPINGSCGTANRTYAYNATDYGVDSFCSAGSTSPANPAFPAQGASTPWTCQGQNGGTNASCNASRNNPPVTLSVNVVTSGQGTVTSTSNPSQTNINCGALCVATYDVGTQITLTAQPSSPSRIFIGWAGDCSGTNPTCTLTVDSAKSVTARFGINPNFKEF